MPEKSWLNIAVARVLEANRPFANHNLKLIMRQRNKSIAQIICRKVIEGCLRFRERSMRRLIVDGEVDDITKVREIGAVLLNLRCDWLRSWLNKVTCYER